MIAALLVALVLSIALNVRLWIAAREARRGRARLLDFTDPRKFQKGAARVRAVDEKPNKENPS